MHTYNISVCLCIFFFFFRKIIPDSNRMTGHFLLGHCTWQQLTAIVYRIEIAVPQYLGSFSALLDSLWSQAFQRLHKKKSSRLIWKRCSQEVSSAFTNYYQALKNGSSCSFWKNLSSHLIKLGYFLSYKCVMLFWVFDSLVVFCTLQEQPFSSSKDCLLVGIVTCQFNQTSPIL